MVGIKLFIQFLLISLSLATAPLLRLSLNGSDWKALPSLGRFGSSANPLQAWVPGSMYMDLYSNGVITDPYYRFNDMKYGGFANQTWTYTKGFIVSDDQLNNTHIDLVCDGIDTFSTITLNGDVVGQTYNQFIQHRFPLRNLQKNNVIEVIFESPLLKAKSLSSAYPYTVPPECSADAQHGQCHVNFIRKEQASFSWDWGPSFPTIGIWKDIRLEFYTSKVSPTLLDFSAEVSFEEDSGLWNVYVKANLGGIDDLAVPTYATFTLMILDSGCSSSKNIYFDSKSSDILEGNLPVPDEAVKRWWPNGYSSQMLYTLNVTLGNVTMSKRIGFRTIELIQEPIQGASGLTFLFAVNGQRMFMKGSNWIPADSFQSRITKDRLRDLLTSAQKANMNMLRVWGGGIYEQDDFYDIADELGILIWQDLMFACAMYPTDADFLSNVTLEITQQVNRLKHHPSIALWAGNNENEAALRDNWYGTAKQFDLYKNDYIKLYIDTAKNTVEKEHVSGIFVSSSPSNGKESEAEGWVAQNPYDPRYGDVHYYNYNPGRYFNDDYPRPRFMSEYGYQSWPSFDLLQPLTIPDDWSEFSEFAVNRNHHPDGQNQLNSQITYYFDAPSASTDPAVNFTHYIYLTQINQAMYIKMVSEFCRRSQSYLYGDSGLTMGALYWQLNDIWPGPSWSSLEFDGSWKMLHYYAKNFFSQQMISMAIEAGNLTIYSVFDFPVVKQPLNLTISCYAWEFLTPVSQLTSYVAVSTTTVSTRLINEDLNNYLEFLECSDRSSHFLVASLNGTLESSLPLSPYKSAVGLKHPTITIVVDNGKLAGQFNVMLTTNAVAPFVWLKSSVKGVFSDNGFLLKDETLNITFTSADASVALKDVSVTCTSLMDIYSF